MPNVGNPSFSHRIVCKLALHGCMYTQIGTFNLGSVSFLEIPHPLFLITHNELFQENPVFVIFKSVSRSLAMSKSCFNFCSLV